MLVLWIIEVFHKAFPVFVACPQLGLSQFFQNYSRFLHFSPYYSSVFDLLFSQYSCCWSFTTGPMLGGGLQWTLIFCMRSDKVWAFGASNTDLVELGWSFVDDPSPIESVMRYTRYAHAQYTLRNIFTFYLLFLFSKSCPTILKIILEYLAQAYPQLIYK